MTPRPEPRDQRSCQDWEDCRLDRPPVDRLLRDAASRLTQTFPGVFSPESVLACVRESYDLLAAHATVRTHLPILSARFAHDRLRAVALTRGAIVSSIPEVLFVCVHNAGRSQMAAALLHHHAQGRVTVRSAGSAPADTINPAVIEAMAEIGMDLTQEFPKPLTTEAVEAADVVITMGCGDACPIFPGKRYLDWELPDPAGRGIEAVRPIRDDIDARVRALLAELVATGS
ncbi:arsenate reductase ArsC [Actinoalloteichus sp. GBA129-24]|uniref:arsenate reductase ArsC n=1 Tax=Actinoalloteichus sp. GBA129-24 TaxID=1612551 RepID=UPI0009508C15|nr:arsenate reductase ArsC [Actinoalloteichus sp. GBA129-24]APU21981.1 protein-tyrosine-phosphatase [Actinoalloteichus sp. GBA129-24]